jgi:UDP-glucuronate decarboxylase
MRTLVTGGAGFVGSHLCDRLLADGHEVVVLDNLYTGARENVAHLEGNPRFRLVHHDVTQPYHYLVDRIYNLACPASPVHYQRDPVHTMLTSVLGTLHGLRLAQEVGARFFQASTSEVYGDPNVHPQPESYWGHVNPVGPRACYDEGKRAAETLCFDFQRQHRVEVRVARIFNTYGPRMQEGDGRVVSNFIVQALRGESLTLYGDGKQTRSFCYVDDLVDGFVRLMEHPTESGPVNLGNPVEFTMVELATLIGEVLGRPVDVAHKPLPQDDPRQRRPDIDRAREALGFAPRVPLREGLARTVAYFASRAPHVSSASGAPRA